MRDFYTHQDTARSETRRLLMMFGTAVFVLLLMMCLVTSNVYFVVRYLLVGPHNNFFNVWVICLTGLATIGTVAFGSIWKAHQLQQGGGVALAASLGARHVREPADHHDGELATQLSTTDRKLLNVVQEMAIAAEIPPPRLFVLDADRGINAFAAGYTVKDAVIGVTRGCAERLSREQLQGVVAHEFSHICNGDMLLNMRTLIVLHGIFAIDILGQWLISVAKQLWEDADAVDDDAAGTTSLAFAAAIAGGILMAMGSLGTLCGLFITAAISRQREFLADASAVQLTRHPQCIADALKVIGGYTDGTQLRTPAAAEVSHMFFCQATARFARWLATHPPLEERIARLDPNWDGVPIFETDEEIPAMGAEQAIYGQAMQLVADTRPDRTSVAVEGNDTDADPTWQSEAQSGPAEEYAVTVDQSLPTILAELSQSPRGSQLLLFMLLADTDAPDIRDQWRQVAGEGASSEQAFAGLMPVVMQLDPCQRLRLFDRVHDQVVHLREPHRGQIEQMIDRLSHIEPSHDELIRWSMRLSLRQSFGMLKPPRPKYGSLHQVHHACEMLVSALVHSGHEEEMTLQYAFQRAAAHFSHDDLSLLPKEDCEPAALSEALKELAELAPRAKRDILLAVSACLTADREITAEEAALARGICAGLSTSAPRLLPGQPLLAGT